MWLGKKTRSNHDLPCFSACKKPLDIGLVIDTYDGFTDNDFIDLKLFIADLVSKFTVDFALVHFGIITFGAKAVIKVKFNDVTSYNPSLLENTIKSLPLQTETGHWTDDALKLAKDLFSVQNGHRDSMPSALIVFTAANSNLGSDSYPPIIHPLLVRKHCITTRSCRSFVRSLVLLFVRSFVRFVLPFVHSFGWRRWMALATTQRCFPNKSEEIIWF